MVPVLFQGIKHNPRMRWSADPPLLKAPPSLP